MSETHDKFEAGCDFELDGPEPMADLPIEDRLSAWMAWATYLKQRIKDHYRPRIAALEDELATAKRLNSKWMDEKTAAVMRTEKAERERDELLSENADLRLTLTKDGLLGRMEEAERLGYEIGRNCAEAERHMLKAERDALKCCGNCEYGSLEDCGFICICNGDVNAHDFCHFNPPLWKRREP